MQKIEIGIIGGSGLYEMEGLTEKKEIRLKTPFGSPSDAYITGKLEGRRVAFLTRHGRGHRILPSEINFRANIWGMKKLGVERIISVSAVGSMKETIAPGHVVLPEQFYDHTKRYAKRQFTWFNADPSIRWIDLSESEGDQDAYQKVDAIVTKQFRLKVGVGA